ncbi:hypothetical protein NP493_40g09043 [Ridgeia piscesae]|uniref:Uncharacterized protein n=1 Tax=Ridgeia piscesae TaxID=27915 RepID=A0AAD9UJZ9_RIDPI|nr:hypothetical protein NP493_40g09043 [Ridgeia piscesae]
MAGNLVVAFGSFFTVLSVEIVFISFTTEHWVDIVVNREEISGKVDPIMFKTDLRYFTRYRGLLRTCFAGNETAFLDNKAYDDDRVDGSCLIERGYELTRRPETSNYGSDYTTRIPILIVVGVGFFHGYVYLEKNKLETIEEFPAKYAEESKHAVTAILFFRAAYVVPASSKAFNRQRDDH